MTVMPLQQPRRTYGWRSWRDPLFELLLAIAAGWAVTLIEGAGKDQFPATHVFVRNAILAVSILVLARGLETMLSWAIEQSGIPMIFRTLIYALGAWTGFFLGLLAVAMMYGAEESDFRFHSFHSIYAASEAALIACIVGFILHHNQKRKDRLQLAYERLREHAFAEKELEIARSVQRRLLPPPEIDANGFHISARTDAAHIIGGDFYDVLRLDDGSLAVLVADVSGKGVAASLIMASCKAAMSLLATASRNPSEVMRALNAKLCADLQKREFVAMVYAHCARSHLTIVNAGMPDPLLIANGSCRPVICGGDRLPVGVRMNRDFQTATVDIQDGERLLLFSDGIPEATVNGEPVGYDHVEDLATQPGDIIDRLRAIEGIAIEDDATAVVISRLPDRR